MKILVLCLHAFEMLEFSPFIDVFGWARDDFGCDINVESCGYKKSVTSTFHVCIEVDHWLEDIDIKDYDALVIPGGFEEYGFYEEAYDARTLAFIQAFYNQRKWTASVCVAAFPLAKSGILEGKTATTYHLRGGYKRKELEAFHVKLGNEWIEEDDHIITSSCPKTGVDVAFRLLQNLTSKEKMLEVKQAMGYA